MSWDAKIVGQEAARRALERFLKAPAQGRFLLLTGPRGVGKGTLARAAARALLCAGDTPTSPCGHCLACRNPEGHPDLVLLTDERSIGIDTVRAVAAHAPFAPVGAPRKVWVIDPADRLTTAAANALLRLLEEPPRHLWILGVAHNLGAIPLTLRSRAVRITCDPLAPSELAELLGIAPDDTVAQAGSLERARLLQDATFAELRERWEQLLAARLHDPDGAAAFARAAKGYPGGLAGFWTGLVSLAAGGPMVAGALGADYNETIDAAAIESRAVLLEAIHDLEANVNPAFVCEAVVRRLRAIRKERGRR